jgi:hypothetical protein
LSSLCIFFFTLRDFFHLAGLGLTFLSFLADSQPPPPWVAFDKPPKPRHSSSKCQVNGPKFEQLISRGYWAKGCRYELEENVDTCSETPLRVAMNGIKQSRERLLRRKGDETTDLEKSITNFTTAAYSDWPNEAGVSELSCPSMIEC